MDETKTYVDSAITNIHEGSCGPLMLIMQTLQDVFSFYSRYTDDVAKSFQVCLPPEKAPAKR